MNFEVILKRFLRMNGNDQKQAKHKEGDPLVDLENLNQKRKLQNKVLKRMVEQLTTTEEKGSAKKKKRK